jgi:hypothetical protein
MVSEKPLMNFCQKLIVLRKDSTSLSFLVVGQSAITATLTRFTVIWPSVTIVPKYLTVIFLNWHLTGLHDNPDSHIISKV